MRGPVLRLLPLLAAFAAASGCCDVPCDPCCPPCVEVEGRPTLFANPPPRPAALPGERAAPAPPAPAPAETAPLPVPPGIDDSPETLESK
jgi:hypothetical protein